ncbi:MAG: DNRLRE domain-containing protein [Myxococcaceae bacterium]|nr:MAG: DNRLRE domain-containing protein [Myxococcaceae bacterium]
MSAFEWSEHPGVDVHAVSSLFDCQGNSSNVIHQEALLRFDVSAIPSSATVHNATLQLYAVTQPNAIQVHAANAAWSESTATYSSFNQQFDPTVEATIASILVLSPRTANVTSLVASWVNGSRTNNGFLLEASPALLSVPAILYSSESTSVTERPGLEVCYTP